MKKILPNFPSAALSGRLFFLHVFSSFVGCLPRSPQTSSRYVECGAIMAPHSTYLEEVCGERGRHPTKEEKTCKKDCLPDKAADGEFGRKISIFSLIKMQKSQNCIEILINILSKVEIKTHNTCKKKVCERVRRDTSRTDL